MSFSEVGLLFKIGQAARVSSAQIMALLCLYSRRFMKRNQAAKDLHKSSPCRKLFGMVYFHDVGKVQIKAAAAPIQLWWKEDAKRAMSNSHQQRKSTNTRLSTLADTLFFE